MQVVEIKNNLAKIIYNPVSEHLVLSGFVTLQDQAQMFIAQVINLDAKSDNHFAILKMLFTFDNKGGFSPYSGSIPALESTVQMLNTKEILGVIESIQPVVLGEISEEKLPFKLDLTLFNEKTLVCVDNNDEKNSFIMTLLPQIIGYRKSVVLFDLMGTLSFPNKLIAGKDFKLPLNYDTINFIYEKGLSDASGETKAMIQEIFIEVQNYVKDIPEKFIPFETFKSVVDQQYEELKLNELVLLKNKLLKFYEQGVFAQEQAEFEKLKESLLSTPLIVVDVSAFDGILQREVISYVYSVMKEIGSEYYSVVQIDDDNTDKKLLKQLFVTENVNTVIVAPYKYKYLKEIKQLSKNLILFAPIQQQDDFAGYNVFLSKLNHREFIVYGDRTQYIPFIVSLIVNENENTKQTPQQEQPQQTVQNEEIQPQEETPQVIADEQIIEEIENPQSIEQAEDFQEEILEEQIIQPEEQPLQEEVIPQQEPLQEQEILQEEIISPAEPELLQEDILPSQELPQEPEFVESHVEEPQIIEPETDVQEPVEQEFVQVSQSVDESIVRELNEMESVPASDVQSNAEVLTDEDLDFIQENIQSEQHQEFVQPEDQYIPPERQQEFIQPEDQYIPPERQQEFIQPEDQYIPPERQQEFVQPEDQYIPPERQQEFIQPEDQYIPPEQQQRFAPPEGQVISPANLEQMHQMQQQNNQPQPQPQEFKETPIVPVYPAQQSESPKSNAQFAQGDTVMHETYGKGVVTKIISYGDKVLCSIEFESAGKKLLDPAITQLEKI